VSDPERLTRALAAIDRRNAEDPVRIRVRGEERPKELAHAELVSEWVQKLRPDASEALQLAARAHHLRRWALPRGQFPDGRRGYLRWRREQAVRQADEVAELLASAGYDPPSIARVQQMIRKEGLGKDPEVKTLEDAICLVFLETQLVEFAGRHPTGKSLDVLRKTLRKMSGAGRAAARAAPLSEQARALLEQAVGHDEPE